MRASRIITIIYLFMFKNTDAKCHIVKEVATCDFLNVSSAVYQSVDRLVISDVVEELFLPQYMFRASTFNQLSITRCHINSIRTDTFVDLKVSFLSLTEDEIESVEPGAYKNLTKLEKLIMRHNKLKVIQRGVFTKLPLIVLSLSDNLITTIEDSTFEQLPNLKKLHLDSNKIESIFVHKIIDYPARLEILWLHKNNLRLASNYMLKGLTNLTTLNLGFNQIQTVEEGAFEQTPKLQTLVLTNNQLKEIDGGVFPRTGLKYLERLYLDNNELMFLSSNFFFRLNNLKYVTLVGNPWLCPCLEIISRILYDNRIREKCQFEYSNGSKPVCISESSGSGCSYKYNSALSVRYLQVRNSYISVGRTPLCFL